MSVFSEDMRSRRRDAGMSLRTLARLAHVDAGYLSRIEAGLQTPSPDVAAALDRALGAAGRLAGIIPDRTGPDPVDATARESERLSRMLAGDPDADVSEELAAGTRRLAVAYLGQPARIMLDETSALRRTALDALRARRIIRPSEVTETTRAVGYLSGILTYAAVDLGNPAAAMKHAAVAWDVAEMVGDNALKAWVRGTQSLVARFAGDYPRALAFAEDGLRYPSPGSGRIRLLCGVAQCHANLGNRVEAWKALDEAVTAREHLNDRDQIAGLFTFSEAKQAYYSGSSLIWLNQPQDARRAVKEAGRAITLWSTADPDDRSLDDEALAHVYAATAHLQLGELDAAVDALESILGLPEDRRISWIRKRLGRVAVILSTHPFVGEPLAAETLERIAEYQ